MRQFTLNLFLLFFCAATAQDYGYRSHQHVWNTPTPKVTSFDSAFANGDAVVLHESMAINFSSGATVSIFQYAKHFPGTIRFRKTATIKLLNSKGAEYYSSFRFPESLDPSYDKLRVPFEKSYDKPKPLVFDVTMDHFAIRKISSQGILSSPEKTDKVKVKETFIFYKYYKSDSYEFNVENLQPGDIIEYSYEYSVSFFGFYLFSSNRFFRHGEHPKQVSEFTMSFNPTEIFVYNFNGLKAEAATTNSSRMNVYYSDTALVGVGN